MSKRLLVVTIIVFLLSACATSDAAPDQKAGLLCIEKTDGTGEVIHCLNPLSADPKDVEERVVLHNAVSKVEDQISCAYKKTLGSRFARWNCYYMNRPNANPSAQIGLLDLINRGRRQ